MTVLGPVEELGHPLAEESKLVFIKHSPQAFDSLLASCSITGWANAPPWIEDQGALTVIVDISYLRLMFPPPSARLGRVKCNCRGSRRFRHICVKSAVRILPQRISAPGWGRALLR